MLTVGREVRFGLLWGVLTPFVLGLWPATGVGPAWVLWALVGLWAAWGAVVYRRPRGWIGLEDVVAPLALGLILTGVAWSCILNTRFDRCVAAGGTWWTCTGHTGDPR